MGLTRFPHVRIAGHVLHLGLAYKHERRYYEVVRSGVEDVDTLIAERFVRPGDVVLDAGANIGFRHAQYLAQGAAEVHAIEPVEALHKRLARLKDHRIRAYNLALSDREGTAEIFRSRGHNQDHSLNPVFVQVFPEVFGETPEMETVRLTTMDALCSRGPDSIS